MFRAVLKRVRAKAKFLVLGGAAVAAVGLSTSTASAQWGCNVGSYGGYNAYGGHRPHTTWYHGPSVHYHKQFHGYSHWTPGRGYHLHGHYHYVPHFTPGHFHHD